MTIAKCGKLAISAAATALLLSACGGPAGADPEFLGQSPRAITKTAFAQMRSLTSVRILGTVMTTDGRIRIDLKADDQGGCTGSLRLNHGSARFIHTPEGTWLKADESFWRANAQSPKHLRQIQASLGTSWTQAPAKTADFEGLCSATTMLVEFKARKDGGEGRFSKGDVELIGETEAIAINKKGGGHSSTVWVSVATPHRVVKLASREGGNPTTLSFEDFGVAVDAEAPHEDDVVELTAYAENASPKG